MADGYASQKNEKSSAGITGATSRTLWAPSMEAATADTSAAARGSFTVGGYSSRVTPSAEMGAKLTCAVQPCASAVAVVTCWMRPCSHSNTSLSSARKVPPSSAASPMTLLASPPARKMVTDSTADLRGSVRRLTTVCSAMTTAEPHTTASMFLCGTAAWPPAPVSVISNDPLPARMVPARVPTVPLGVSGYGQLCSANMDCSGGAMAPRPASSIRRAPAPPSSAGWNTSRTVPGSSASMPFSTLAAPSSMAVWPSCPHACILPGVWLRRSSGMSASSVSGSASMSARSPTTGAPPLPMLATIPGDDTSSKVMPMLVSSRFTTAEVWCSDHMSSGIRCSSRRMRTT
mmetsp:Transcript_16746/g.41104  ORF Transcript_16746/g.41104 Transcript_16746/m.41104 type:complete len:346 (-) Transcript_16746:304-1341(-)